MLAELSGDHSRPQKLWGWKAELLALQGDTICCEEKQQLLYPAMNAGRPVVQRPRESRVKITTKPSRAA